MLDDKESSKGHAPRGELWLHEFWFNTRHYFRANRVCVLGTCSVVFLLFLLIQALEERLVPLEKIVAAADRLELNLLLAPTYAPTTYARWEQQALETARQMEADLTQARADLELLRSLLSIEDAEGQYLASARGQRAHGGAVGSSADATHPPSSSLPPASPRGKDMSIMFCHVRKAGGTTISKFLMSLDYVNRSIATMCTCRGSVRQRKECKLGHPNEHSTALFEQPLSDTFRFYEFE